MGEKTGNIASILERLEWIEIIYHYCHCQKDLHIDDLLGMMMMILCP